MSDEYSREITDYTAVDKVINEAVEKVAYELGYIDNAKAFTVLKNRILDLDRQSIKEN